MSRELLQAAVERRALRPKVNYADLAEVHVDLDLLSSNGGHFEEKLVRAGGDDRGCTAVLGWVGAGKSSLIAAAAARLEQERFVVRVRSLGLREGWTRVAFAQHLAEETLETLRSAEAGPRLQKLKSPEGRLAASSRRSTGGHALGTRGSQLRSAAQEVTRQQQPTQILSAVEELVNVAAGTGRPLLILVEDTDSFMPPKIGDTEDDRRADTFAAEVLPYLARELECPSFVAVHLRYQSLLDGLPVEDVEITPFADSVGVLGKIIGQYLRAASLHADADELFEREALVWLAAIMKRDGDVRKGLRAVEDTVDKTLKEDPEAERVTLAVAESIAIA